MRKYKICGIVTKAFAIRAFMLDNLKYVHNNGFESSFVCEPEDFSKEELDNIKYHPITMKRGYVSPFEIIRVIYQLMKLFKKEQYDIIQYSSSNAGLYAAVAGWLANVPIRIFCMWGLTFTDSKGWNRLFYKYLDKIICLMSTSVQPDSYANLKVAISEKLISHQKGSVIHKGSATGVDLEKFDIRNKDIWRKEIRDQYKIPQDAIVIGFVGRLVPEKGLNELFEAFKRVDKDNVYLLLVGPYYNISGLDQQLYEWAQKNERVIFVGPVLNPAKFYAAMDFFTLPSYREGFGSVVIEAAAMGLPTICTNIKGPTDFLKDNYNGLLCEVRSSESLYNTIIKALSLSMAEYKMMSENAYFSVKSDYDAKVFKKYFLENRLSLIRKFESTHKATC